MTALSNRLNVLQTIFGFIKTHICYPQLPIDERKLSFRILRSGDKRRQCVLSTLDNPVFFKFGRTGIEEFLRHPRRHKNILAAVNNKNRNRSSRWR